MGSRQWTPPYGVRQPDSGPTQGRDSDGGATQDPERAPAGDASRREDGKAEAVRNVGSGLARQGGAVPTRIGGAVSTQPLRDAGGSNGSSGRASPRLMLPPRQRDRPMQLAVPEAPPTGGELVVRDDQANEICFVKHTMPEAVDPRLVLAIQRDSARAASFRLLRQRLVEHGDPRVVLVTSARSREGKTIAATNLAMAYAELGRSRVLIVEANFRSASLGEVFGFKPPRSFSAQLERHRSKPVDPWVVVQVVPFDVHVMAINPSCCVACSTILVKGANFCPDCGRPVTSEPPRLDRSGFAAAIKRFREAFDYVIIDGPSVLESADVNLIQDTADGIVMTARSGHTDARALKKAMDQVSPAPVLGVVLVED